MRLGSRSGFVFLFWCIFVFFAAGTAMTVGGAEPGEAVVSDPAGNGSGVEPGEAVVPDPAGNSSGVEPGEAVMPDPAGNSSLDERLQEVDNLVGQIENVRKDKLEASENLSMDKRFVTIDFDNVDIAIFIKYISELTGKNFIIDKGVKGSVTIISPTKISEEEAYKVFESVLEVNGFATVPSGSVVKVVPAIEARTKNIATGLLQESGEPDDKIVTQLIPLKYADPEELKKVFSPLVSKNSVVISYPPTGMLIITDVLSNINRLLKIIKEIDVTGADEEISVILMKYASASEVGKSLSSVFPGTGKRTAKTISGGPPTKPAEGPPTGPAFESLVKIIPDERINALIVLATKEDTAEIRNLIELLDREVPRGEGNIQVYYLQNAIAEDLAAVLTAIPAKGSEPGRVPSVSDPVISKDVQIVADKSTNSLVITAKKADYLVLEDVIKKLDIPRRMVYIEALIMEVKVEKEFKLGVEMRALNNLTGGKDAVIGGFAGQTGYTNIAGLQGDTPTLPTGFSLGVIGEIIQVNNNYFPTLGALIQAYKSDNDVEIIATPQIMTTDNEEAEIKVGENVPYITREEQSSSGLNYSTYEYKDVGVTLKLTPQINQEGVVRLNIFQEVVKLAEGSVEFRPTTLKRSAQTTVIVKDKNTVVIGGLIDETLNDGYYKVPLLGDIPVLGYLFKSTTKKQNKTNLFIFITPHIISNPAEAANFFESKKEEINSVDEGLKKLIQKKYRSQDEGK